MPELPPIRPTLEKRKPIRNQKHLEWVRNHLCCIKNCRNMNIQAAHVRVMTDGGMGMKPGDNWAVSLCYDHHAEQHRIGERSFEAKWNINLKALAQEFWAKSPHRSET